MGAQFDHTNAGHKCQYPARLSTGSFRISSLVVHEASGERLAPFGRRPFRVDPGPPRRKAGW
jgi:hypothetical protein